MKLSTMALLSYCTRAVLIQGDDLDTNEVALYSDVVATGEQKEVEEFQFFEDSMDNDTTFDNICDIELYKTLFIGKEKKTKKQVISEIFKKSYENHRIAIFSANNKNAKLGIPGISPKLPIIMAVI